MTHERCTDRWGHRARRPRGPWSCIGSAPTWRWPILRATSSASTSVSG